MKPTLSLILFSVLSGAGFGIYMLLALLSVTQAAQPLAVREVLTAGILGLALVIAGLLSSTGHLANPRNGIKAFNRLRTSWLSREATFALLFLVLAVLYLASVWTSAATRAPLPLGLVIAAAVAALATLFSMSMIYASLKTIRQWHNPLVPPAYLFIGLAMGGVLLTAVRVWWGYAPALIVPATLTLLAVAAFVKLTYWFWIGQPEGPTLNTATGITGRLVQLLDVGHSHGTFLTDEFGHGIGAGASRGLRGVALVAAFVLPFASLTWLQHGGGRLAATLAVLAVFAGILLERWLFLIEGRHVVNLYHGQQRT